MTTPLVLLHAFPLSSAMWGGVRERLAVLAPSLPVLAPDLPGFGGRPAPTDPPSVDVLADALARELDAQGIGRIVLCGLSMGGYVAMAFLRRHGERVDAVVLADTKGGRDPEPARDNRERIARVVLEERSPRVLVEDVMPGLLAQTTKDSRPEVVAEVRALLEASDPEGVAWAQRAMAARPDSLPSLHEVEVPGLVIVGDQDALSPVPEAETMVTALPDARLVVVPGAGHLSAVEEPDAFARALVEFLDDL